MTAQTASRWLRVGALDDIEFGPGALCVADGHEFAVFRHADGYHALDNSCPHAGAALAAGCVEGDRVFCPWHGWEFEIPTGRCTTMAEDSTRAYPIRVVDGHLEIGVPDGWTARTA